jgi:membrane protease YdiL (CAAX protease family)
MEKQTEKSRHSSKGIYVISSIIALLAFIQLLLLGFKHFFFLFFERTNFSDSIATMFGMIILSDVFVVFASKQKVSLSVFPRIFNKYYIIGTLIAVILLVATPSNYLGDFQNIILLFYGSVITPIFEEIIFRGYAWNKLNTVIKKEWGTYLITSVFFGIWHLGYIESIAFRVETGLVKIMLMKVVIGIVFGVVLGVLRLKTKNCYSTILLHGVLNIFGK